MVELFLEEFEETIKLLNLILVISGNDILNENWSKGFKGKVKRFLPTLTLCFLPIACGNAVQHHLHDFTKMFESLITAGSCIQVVFKMFLLQFLSKDLIDIINTCRNFRIKYASEIFEENKMNVEIVLIKRPILVIKYYYIMFIVNIIGILMGPLLKIERTLPFYYYLPIGAPFESPNYESNYIFIVIELILTIHLVAGVDALFIFFVAEMCLQCNIIKFKLSSIEKLGDVNKKNDILREVHEMYQHLTSMISTINGAFSKILLTQFLTSLVMITITLFLVTAHGHYNLIVTFCAVVSQLSVYCLYGEFLNNKLEKFIFLLYEIDWYNLKIKEQKSLVTMMSFGQIKLSLKAGGYVELSLSTYFQILKTAYTYYAVMRDQQM